MPTLAALTSWTVLEPELASAMTVYVNLSHSDISFWYPNLFFIVLSAL